MRGGTGKLDIETLDSEGEGSSEICDICGLIEVESSSDVKLIDGTSIAMLKVGLCMLEL